ncbi:hypothetical protein EYF80_056138 [Liparis tanakae]|uniref:Uncharacterized protein n=1 Tax=Liparis tanakae TaxID=230148 RepID=A0A4Z2EXM7_9TELE|nr:hypothetical protein EYF80_056138 [Liparis tanakae]
MNAKRVVGEETPSRVPADADIPTYLFQPDYTAEEMQNRSARLRDRTPFITTARAGGESVTNVFYFNAFQNVTSLKHEL